jgi:diguanylate cyclase (GGDEF)-like protein
MTNVLIGVSAGLGALALLLLLLLLVRSRQESSSEDRVADVVAGLNARMDELSRELALALERAEEEGRRSRAFGELAGSIDLDEVLSRTLEAAAAIRGADAALVMLTDPIEGKPVVAASGLSAEETERHAVAGPPDGRLARAIRMSYTYSERERRDADGAVIQSGLAVPLPGDDESLGYLAIFTRQVTEFREEDVRDLEALAVRAGPAIDNARRFREARQLADLDALTNLHNRRFFHETLSREVARAHRYGRRLALIVFDLDDFKVVNDKVGHLAGDSVLAEVAERVRGVVRSADIACRVGGDEFAIILPESTLDDADQLYRRIRSAVSIQPLGHAGNVFLSAGVAGLSPDDDATMFFQRADEALYRAKGGGKGRVISANL